MNYNEQESHFFNNFPLIVCTKGIEDGMLMFGVRGNRENTILNL